MKVRKRKMSNSRVLIVFDPDNISSCLAVRISQDEKHEYDIIPWYSMKNYECPPDVERKIDLSFRGENNTEMDMDVCDNLKAMYVNADEKDIPTVVNILIDQKNENYHQLVEGSKLIEHDPRTEDGSQYLDALLENQEGWNAMWQTINAGAVACMVKNQVYRQLMREYPDVELDDPYFKKLKEYEETNNTQES